MPRCKAPVSRAAIDTRMMKPHRRRSLARHRLSAVRAMELRKLQRSASTIRSGRGPCCTFPARDAFKAGGAEHPGPAILALCDVSAENWGRGGRRKVRVQRGRHGGADQPGRVSRKYTNISERRRWSRKRAVNLTRSAAEARIQGIESKVFSCRSPVSSFRQTMRTPIPNTRTSPMRKRARCWRVLLSRTSQKTRFVQLPAIACRCLLPPATSASWDVQLPNPAVDRPDQRYGVPVYTRIRPDQRSSGLAQRPVRAAGRVGVRHEFDQQDLRHRQFDSYNSSFGFVTRTYGEPRMYGAAIALCIRQMNVFCVRKLRDGR